MSASHSPSRLPSNNGADVRPLKRSRKKVEEDCSLSQDSSTFDHIFITDGLAKKEPTKKPPLSCAECRRLKLKCDRVFPCKSCSKRGCAEICPSGVLVSGKGTRFILANTEQLHTKIIQMSDRIRNLEQVVQTLQSKVSSHPHPMLAPELLQIKSALGLYGGVQKGVDHVPSPMAPQDDQAQQRRSDQDTGIIDQLLDDDGAQTETGRLTPQSDRAVHDPSTTTHRSIQDVDVMHQLSSHDNMQEGRVHLPTPRPITHPGDQIEHKNNSMRDVEIISSDGSTRKDTDRHPVTPSGDCPQRHKARQDMEIVNQLSSNDGMQEGTDRCPISDTQKQMNHFPFPIPTILADDREEHIKSVHDMEIVASDGTGKGTIHIHSSATPGNQVEHNNSTQDMEIVEIVDDNDPPTRSYQKNDVKCETHDDVPTEIMQLSHQFPIANQISPDTNLPLRQEIRNMLPPQPEAWPLWEQVRQNALWQFNPHPNESFMPNLLHHVYSSPLEELCPRRLALFLMICAVGCLVDLDQPSDSPDAERYHHLARASLCEIPVMEDTNVDAILALFYMTWYLLVFSDKKKAAGYAWGVMGLTAKLAQSIGLHRDGTKSKVIPEEVEKRRALFWELMYLDARLSLALGRPPSLFLRHMDCKRPSYTPDPSSDPSGSLHHYQEWKHSCYIQCLNPVLEITSSPSLEYSKVIELDRTIRDFYIPPVFQRAEATLSRPSIMQKASLSTALEAVLLQLHRSFFTRALSGPEEAFNRRHRYAPSVVAVFLSASRMIATVATLYRQEPELTSRILWYWSNAFSAAMALCLLVSRAPFTCLSPAALQELERARVLFTSAKERCPRALQVVPVLESMVEKAIDIYVRWASGRDEPNLALRHEDDAQAPRQRTRSALDYAKTFMSEPTASDSFVNAHPSLSQCITEVHQRALALFPLRKQCQCSTRCQSSEPCTPTSRQCTPLPKLSTPSPTSPHSQYTPSPVPVLPDLYTGSFRNPRLGSSIISTTSTTTSRMAVVETLNFDFGAINSSWSDQSWMAWF